MASRCTTRRCAGLPLGREDLLKRARNLQRRLERRVIEGDPVQPIQRVAGIDVAYRGAWASAAVAVFGLPHLQEVASAVAVKRGVFDYVPGFFALRELPLMTRALRRLARPPEVVLVDGHGRAHPRRFGAACHLGVVTGLATVGCAKTRLIGAYREPGPEAGCSAPLFDGIQQVGAVVRTRKGVRPVFVSVGHRITLDTAVACVLACCRGCRLPEPLRRAHQLARLALASAG